MDSLTRLLKKKDGGWRMELYFFFDINDNSETNPEFLWESAKAYIRGFTVSYMSHRKKLQKQNELETYLKKEEPAHKSRGTRSNLIKVK